MNSNRFSPAATGLLILWVSLCMSKPSAGGEVMSLAVRPGSTLANGQATVVLETRRPQGLGALEVEIVYDPQVLEARSVTKEALLANGMLEYDLRPGRVRCVMINGEPITADGAVLAIHFESKRDSGQTTIGLENIKAWDFNRALEMRVSAAPGDLTLQPPLVSQEATSRQPWPWSFFAVPAGIVVLSVLILWVYRLGRRRGVST